jgi:hypothetical protein
MLDLRVFVLAQLQVTKGHWPFIAQASGVSVRNIRKIATETIESPRVHNLQKLANCFEELRRLVVDINSREGVSTKKTFVPKGDGSRAAV